MTDGGKFKYKRHMILRPYQIESINQIREAYRGGERKVLLHLPTGAGKTTIFCEMAKRAVENNKRVMIVVRGRMLVENAAQRLRRENLDHGIMMAGHRGASLFHTQVCSIDTLTSRQIAPPADFIIIDEAHQATSEGYQWLAKQYPNAHFLGVTATPYQKKSLRHIANKVVSPINMRDLIELGFLVPIRYFAPFSPDLSNIKIQNGEYHQGELAEVMDEKGITADLVTTYEESALGRPAVCFAVNRAHSRSIVMAFNDAGIVAKHCDANTSDDERAILIEKLQSGEIQVLSNVGILTTGVDIPLLSTIIMARPTRSTNLWIQMVGRGTRAPQGKSDCLLLDHASNTKVHGFIDEDREVNLDGKQASKKERDIKICKECFSAFYGPVCTNCGTTPELLDREILEIEGELEELVKSPQESKYDLLRKIAKDRGYNYKWAFYKMRDEFGKEIAEKYFPEMKGAGIKRMSSDEVSRRLGNLIGGLR